MTKSLLTALVCAGLFCSVSFAVTPDRIPGQIQEQGTIPLSKSLPRRAQAEYDRGPVEPTLRLDYMTLVIKPSPAQQKALAQLLAQQQDPASANYHKWLTPAQFADQFGLSSGDLTQVTSWLKSQGFKVLSVAGGRNAVVFSGTAAQVQRTFKAEVHYYNVDGEEHLANSTPLMIPGALNGIVGTIRGVHNFGMHPASARALNSFQSPRRNLYDERFAFPNFLAPVDVSTIYDLGPLYNATTPINGTGQKIAVIGRTDVFLADLNDFRTGFGLSSISGCTTGTSGLITACNTTNFRYVVVGTDSGTISAGDLGESDLDIEWTGAVASGAQIIFVNGQTNDGIDDALAAAINPPSGPPLATVVSMSYGICEAESGNLETELMQGNAEGVTILNSSDDIGSAGCDFNPPSPQTVPYKGAALGLAVSYPASSPEVTAVGGTGISVANDTAPNAYFSTTNGSTFGNALKYVPETAWNDDESLGGFCASNPQYTFCNPTESLAITNAQTFQENYWISQGGGGASNCYNENGSVCTSGFAQPSWQNGLTVSGAPTGVRWVPDVSFLASPDLPGYIFCTPQDPGGTPPVYTSTCASGIFFAVDTYASIVGGTSVSTPVFAGMVAMLNQYLGSSGLGNINPRLYALAQTPANGVFHKDVVGDNMVYCQAGTPAAQPAAIRCPAGGVMGYSAANADSTTGYNLVTGLGSIDANNLALSWSDTRATTTTTISASASTVNQGTSVTFTATVTPSTATGTVNFYNNGSTTALGSGTLTSGVATFATTTLPGGANSVTAGYAGDSTNNTSTSTTPAVVNVTASDFTIGANPGTVTVVAGHTSTTPVTVTIAPVNGFNQTVTFTCTNASLPTGATCNFTPATVTPDGTHSSTTLLTFTTVANTPAATTSITVTGTSSGATHSTTVALTVTATDQSFTLAATAASYQVLAGQSVVATVNLTPVNGFNTPVTYTCTTPALQSTCVGPAGATATSPVTFTIRTTGPTTELRRPLDRSPRIFYAALIPGLFGIMFIAGSRKRSLRGMRMLGLIVMLGFSTMWLGSCGGSTKAQNNPGTLPGSYTITVNASTGGTSPITGSTTFTLQVQQQ
jgi:subtilase family serine protease